ncbi:hypothetical protein RHSIM_Rhsim03G0269300 [Rhododendron simsii]|uniref:Uncharacterized protein n=1 Tax=Rhododendron simsii TaxID=118357 RepID=A0A834H478_RHOSS|nr:hypothetical protein RHSIM_Rhsim03G0269300 [Rhododendron simsii]
MKAAIICPRQHTHPFATVENRIPIYHVDVSSDLPHSIDLLTASGKKVVIGVKYPWRPTRCSCNVGQPECNKYLEIDTDKIVKPAVVHGQVWVVKPSKNVSNSSAPTASVASVIAPKIILPCATNPVVSVITPAAAQIILPCAIKFTALQEGEDVSVAISNDDNVVLPISPTVKDAIEAVQCNVTVFG